MRPSNNNSSSPGRSPPAPPSNRPDHIIGGIAQTSLEKERYAARAEVDTDVEDIIINRDAVSADIGRLQDTITLLQQRLDARTKELKEQRDQVEHWKAECKRWQQKDDVSYSHSGRHYAHRSFCAGVWQLSSYALRAPKGGAAVPPSAELSGCVSCEG